MRLVDTVCPPRLGTPFRWLLASSWSTNLADGLAFATGPLLVASQTSHPVLVAGAGLLQRLPWLLFGLQAGAIADRVDRRHLIMAVNLARAAVMALIAATILSGTVNLAVVLVAMFLLGTAETFADITGGTLLPMMVESADLGVANARLTVGHITVNQLVGPSVGAFLFAAGAAVPFVAQAVLLAAGAGLASRMVLAPLPPPASAGSMRAEISAGARWLWHHPPMRTLALTVMTFNVTFGASLSILVLYARERLGLGELGFGVLVTVGAVGGIVGTMAYGFLERTLGMATLMRIGLLIETGTHLTLAVTTVAGVALVTLTVFGMHEAVWGTTVNTVRQRSVPDEFQGRVNSVYLLALMGGLVVGAALGGAIAQVFGVTGPFWFAFVGSAAILAVIWRRLNLIVRAP
jgi:MFS family permease